MKNYSVAKAKEELDKLMGLVNEEHMPILLTRKNGDAVLISAEDWNVIAEMIDLNEIPGMVDNCDVIDSLITAYLRKTEKL